ncbi:N-alpha-acetyltransferase 30 [Auxenochlorella protothecoides]|uniref:N-alpha-acetyltransferase 30 n=2 Tax=Auxenochlorella protothecoides TaxID=3075 RepID=A0A087SI78_AUXPR|nr:N-alpha-acetyltransferase 30 [Auxenochlorella protothecoides]KFM25432.1 N-alpha-acetyltransferase 30 [Auxenochlorella protothecoides]
MAEEATSTSGRPDACIAYHQYRNEEDMRTVGRVLEEDAEQGSPWRCLGPHLSNQHPPMSQVMGLVDAELSEPYSIFTYRYFLRSWPQLCFLARDGDRCFGAIVAKLERHRDALYRGYIAMLVVEKPYRVLGVGSQLVRCVIQTLQGMGCEEVALEAEVTNVGALRLYERLGFVRDKRLKRYYLNGSDAFRLKLLLPLASEDAAAAQQLDALSLTQAPYTP